eukprot:c29296_g1_i2 orf=329-1480(+)
MGALCSKEHHIAEEVGEQAQAKVIDSRIAQEAKAEKGIHKLLLLGAGESGKSTIFKQLKVLFQTGFDDMERRSYIPAIHANVYQSIKILHDASKEFAETEEENTSKYILRSENQVLGEKLSEIGGLSDLWPLTEELALNIQTVWMDPAIQTTFLRASELQLPDCAHFFMEHALRLAQPNYTPTQEDILYARVRTTGIVEIEFSPKEDAKKGEIYRLFDVGGQRNERRKWIHLFDGVTAVIFCAALSEYDQTLFEDESKNRMMEARELFDWILKVPWFQRTSFLLFLNKFDIFEKKVLKVPLSVCEWFKDYKPLTTGKQEIEHAYEFVKRKFEEVYVQNTPKDKVDRVFQIYRTTALDQTVVKKTFSLVDQALTRQRLIDAGLL